jgi:hypothetical protein
MMKKYVKNFFRLIKVYLKQDKEKGLVISKEATDNKQKTIAN